tara:strand:- start:6880 stop:7218 length:339 start_codon:yes stop_codon:yes gene_type:complete
MKKETYKNIDFFIGENAQDNWNILDNAKKINENFIWFHLNSFPSSFVIMYQFINDNSCNTELLNFGANLCKQNSKYKYLKDIKICYTTLNKLNKTNKIGEVTIVGKKKTIKL